MAEAALAEILGRMEAAIARQTTSTDLLPAQAAATEDRFSRGDANVQGVVAALEQRLSESERKLADTMMAVSGTMTALQAQLEHRLTASESHMAAVLQRLAAPTTPAASGGPASTPMPTTSTNPPGLGATPTTSPVGDAGRSNGGMPFEAAAAHAFEAARAPPAASWAPTTYAMFGGDQVKSKDFAHIVVFDGDLGRFPDWADRMSAKMSRAHPRLAAILAWAERQTEVITEDVELKSAEPGLDIVSISGAVFDILMERTGPRLFDKRRNAGHGRGLEFWRMLKRDFGTESTDAQLAKLQMYIKPGRCSSTQILGEALDRWEALGRELTRPVDDDFRLLALRELVPKSIADMMATQVALRTFPEALMFVRRQVADHRHASQVQAVQRHAQQGPAPMDLSILLAAIAQLRGEGEGSMQELAGGSADGDLETIVAALKGKGKKGQGKGKTESRECYNCGKTGHLARDCTSPQAKGGGKGKGKKGQSREGKGESKGKDWHVGYLGSDDHEFEEGISLGCLARAETRLNAMGAEAVETWEGYECIEALMDSGAGECVCGPQHFQGIETQTDPERAGAGTEYICADGGRIPNMGEKLVCGLSEEGSKLSINFQVTTVDKPLIAVSKLTAAGHQVWFGKQHGVITHGVTGKTTTFEKKNGVYVLRVWAPRPATARTPSSSGGIRQ